MHEIGPSTECDKPIVEFDCIHHDDFGNCCHEKAQKYDPSLRGCLVAMGIINHCQYRVFQEEAA